jgi:hypothetical protein
MTDFLIDTANGTLFANGDIRTGLSDNQHKRHLLLCQKGSFKQYPATGVGAADFLESEDEAGFLREIRAQFTADGMTVRELKLTGEKLEIDASY